MCYVIQLQMCICKPLRAGLFDKFGHMDVVKRLNYLKLFKIEIVFAFGVKYYLCTTYCNYSLFVKYEILVGFEASIEHWNIKCNAT